MADVFTGFDFLGSIDPETYPFQAIDRLNRRHDYIVQAKQSSIVGASVLDLACYDGRWSYAFAGAGSATVVGVGARADALQRFDSFPPAAFKQRVELHHGDHFEFLERQAAQRRRFDVIALAGVYLMDHYRLLRLAHQLRPRLIIIDGAFSPHPWPIIVMMREDPWREYQVAPSGPGAMRPIGTPSRAAMETMAAGLDYQVEWADWQALPEAQRTNVRDYYRRKGRVRSTAYLTPKDSDAA